jgi:hypothetical protein
LKETHYKFAAEIVAEMLVLGVPENERLELVHSQFAKSAQLFPVFALTDQILSMYIRERRLA